VSSTTSGRQRAPPAGDVVGERPLRSTRRSASIAGDATVVAKSDMVRESIAQCREYLQRRGRRRGRGRRGDRKRSSRNITGDRYERIKQVSALRRKIELHRS